MKKYLFLLLFLFVTSATYSQGIFALFTRSQEFFEQLEKGNYMDAHAMFDLSVQDKLPAETLKSLWGQMKTNYGALESMDVSKSSSEQGNFQVYLEGKFASGSQSFLLVYNKEQKLIGLFLAPKQNTAEYKSPAYVDTTKFSQEEIYVETAGHKLVGKLTFPKNAKNYPVVVLVHGSGPGDMDQSIGPNKPFKDIAEGLATQGIATIRYVKRTLIYSAEFRGSFTVKEETIDDAQAALALAKATPGVDPKKVYLLGHSLGAMLAPRIAGANADVAGIIIAAGPARKLGEVIIEQNKYFYELSKDTTAAMRSKYNDAVTQLERTKLTALTNMKGDSVISGLPAAYWVDLNKMNQVNIAKGLSKPRIFIAQGGMDFQVTKTDFDVWTKTFTGKKNATLKYYPELDHFFIQQTEKGTLRQYENPSNVSLQFISDIAAWIKG